MTKAPSQVKRRVHELPYPHNLVNAHPDSLGDYLLAKAIEVLHALGFNARINEHTNRVNHLGKRLFIDFWFSTLMNETSETHNGLCQFNLYSPEQDDKDVASEIGQQLKTAFERCTNDAAKAKIKRFLPMTVETLGGVHGGKRVTAVWTHFDWVKRKCRDV